ncbi:MAG: hypothetical protein V1929_12460 [bacterium]
MKFILKILVVVLATGLCGALVFLLEKTSNRQKVSQVPSPQPVRKKPSLASSPVPVPTNTAPQGQSLVATNVAVSRAVQTSSTASALPAELNYKPAVSIIRNGALLPLHSAVSNAVLSVDRILKSQNFNVHEYSRTVWLVSEDHAQSTVWKIFPYKTNAVVGSVEAIVYQDAAMTQKDPARSFQMSFDPETGALRGFSWADKHEVLLVLTNGTSDYARDLGGKMGLVMRWNKQGDLVSSNVYNWATRGQSIGAEQQRGKTPYRLGPTSAVEAATESWRRGQANESIVTNNVQPQSPLNAPTSP